MSQSDETTGTDGGSSTDAQAAAELGTTEGEVREAARESAAVHQPGSEGTRAVWEATPDGQKFKDEEDDRQQEIADEAEAAHKDDDAEDETLDERLADLKENSDEE